MDWNDKTYIAIYNKFKVGSEEEKFKLEVGQFDDAGSTLGDSLAHHNSQKFSTMDQDNDAGKTYDCANVSGGGGGWWYEYCWDANLNGLSGQGKGNDGGIMWTKDGNRPESASTWWKATEMTIEKIQ